MAAFRDNRIHMQFKWKTEFFRCWPQGNSRLNENKSIVFFRRSQIVLESVVMFGCGGYRKLNGCTSTCVTSQIEKDLSMQSSLSVTKLQNLKRIFDNGIILEWFSNTLQTLFYEIKNKKNSIISCDLNFTKSAWKNTLHCKWLCSSRTFDLYI